MIAGTLRVQRLTTREEAARIVDFFFSPESFDDTRHTPGEIEHFKTLPYRAMDGEAVFWFVTDGQGAVVGVNSIAENEQGTGGYSWDYIVVHKDYRHRGVASALIAEMMAHLRSIRARYVVTYTCDLPSYGTIRKLFVKSGFEQVGRLPDYYYDGEDRIIYARRVV